MELVETGLMHKTTGVALGNKPLRQNLKKKKRLSLITIVTHRKLVLIHKFHVKMF